MTITDNLQTIGERIRKAEQRYGRPAQSVQLLAVSKHQPLAAIEEAIAAGQWAFGENYVQELQLKAGQLKNRPEPLEWHFIGPLQSNKTRTVAEIAHWVHTIDRFKIAQRLSEQKPAYRSDLQICIQVNVSQEDSKSGVAPKAVLALAQQIQTLPGLQLRGLMAIPAPASELASQRLVFAELRQLFEQLNQHGFQLDTLSMGMTDDMEAAIAEGATWVRIGTAIFGTRTTTH